MCTSEPLFFQKVWSGCGVGGVNNGETNSSLGDEGKHNYVQFSS